MLALHDVPLDAVQDLAAKEKVCVRPLMRRVVDTVSGEVALVTLPCQSTRESQCPSCASKARSLRIQQCMEGWHLDHEPESVDAGPAVDAEEVDDDGKAVEGEESGRRTRSTRRRDDMPDLPRVPQEDRTIGQAFEGRGGKIYRPSMFITLTLPSYGKVVPGTGIPVDSAAYNYRRAALDALHFSKLLDRWFQNVRRCAGYKVQYFGAVEAQRRLAPHFHVATRGVMPRRVIKAVTRATYLTLWWPPLDKVRYAGVLPEWDGRDYVDPWSGEPLQTWGSAMADLELDDAARPAHVMRFGQQVDIQGLIAGQAETERAVRYLTKYLTKALAETYGGDSVDPAYEAHIDRLHREVRWLPCSPDCANWLRFGIQPRSVGPGLRPGFCASKAHDREHLGLGGRRVLVSRGWSGKRLSDHRADRAQVVREALECAGIEMPVASRMAASVASESGEQRFQWAAVVTGAGTRSDLLMLTILERRHWREQYERAKTLIGANGPPVDSNSAIRPGRGGECDGEALHAG